MRRPGEWLTKLKRSRNFSVLSLKPKSVSIDFFINPILKLTGWKQIQKILGIPGNQNMAFGNRLCGDENICIASTSFTLALDLRGDRQGLFIKV